MPPAVGWAIQPAIDLLTGVMTDQPVTFADGLTVQGGITSSGGLNLSSTLPVPQGGTGSSTFTQGGVLYGNGSSAIGATAAGGVHSVLTSSGGAPVFSATPTLNALSVGSSSIGSSGTITMADNLVMTKATPRLFMQGAGDAGIIGGTTSFQIINNANSTANLMLADDASMTLRGKVVSYKGVSTAGSGVPAIYGYARATGQTAANSSVATYTVGGSDGSFIVSGNVLVTASTTHNFALQVTYTSEDGTGRTVTMNVQQVGGTLVTAITNVTGAGPYEGVPLHIRAQASTAITILTSGVFTSVTYNVEGAITQIG